MNNNDTSPNTSAKVALITGIPDWALKATSQSAVKALITPPTSMVYA